VSLFSAYFVAIVHTMKARLTVTLDPVVVRKAKALALSRDTNFSALVETLLRRDIANEGSVTASFCEKWKGKLSLKSPGERDARGRTLLEKYERSR
jgi:Family of unknown function (DUF6364)